MELKKQATSVYKLLRNHYPETKIALSHKNPMQLLVATILSAQCTDKQVNIVTNKIFKKYKTAKDFARANPKIFEKEIHSTGFYKNKTKNIIASAKLIESKFNGKVPRTMEELLELQGVARKTANVVLSTAFNKQIGVVVDTHQKRLAQRWKLTKHKDPVKIEQDLMQLIPQKYWGIFSLMSIRHGRELCNARKPKCADCFLNKICPSAFKV